MGYSRRTSNYLERITLFDPTYMMSMIDLVAIGVERPRIDSGYSLKKEFTKLFCMNMRMVLYQIVNQFNTCHNCVHGPLT